jgi:hypothetical protein
MRVTFTKLPDHRPGHALVERDDGVVYRLLMAGVSAKLPHDLHHLVVEEALGIGDGIWAAIAGGAVFWNMRHEGGRRGPHAAELSETLQRRFHERLQRAELLAGIVERVASSAPCSADAIRRHAHAHLSTLPPEEVDPHWIAQAAQAYAEALRHWQALPVGGEVIKLWPAHRRLRLPPRRAPAPGEHLRGSRPAGFALHR